MAPSQPMPPRFPTVNTNACFSKAEKDRISKLLTQPLRSSLIQLRVAHGNHKVPYLDGATSLSLANDIFGFDGWRSQIVSSEVEYTKEKQKHSDRWLVGVSVIVRVELKNGSYHEDIGFGEAINMKGRGAALQKAKKEAVTDATKRALRLFGNGLGNCLRKDWYLKCLKKGDTFEDLQLDHYRHPQLVDPEGVNKIKKPELLSEEKAAIVDPQMSSLKPSSKGKLKPNCPPAKLKCSEERFALSEISLIQPSKPALAPAEVKAKPSFGIAPPGHQKRFVSLKVDYTKIATERRVPLSKPPRYISVGPPGCVVALPSLQNPSQSPPSSFCMQASEKFENDENSLQTFGINKRSISQLQILGKKSPKKPRFGRK